MVHASEKSCRMVLVEDGNEAAKLPTVDHLLAESRTTMTAHDE